MARLSRFVTVVALLGGATVSLSACTGGSDPVASPSPSVSTVVTPSPSVSPSPTPLTDEELLALIPEDARGEDFLSASNFAKWFVNEYYVMLNTGDDSLFRALSRPECDFCTSSLAEFDDVIGSGGSVVGGEMTFEEGLAAGGELGDGTTNASFGITIAAVEYFNVDGVVTKPVPASAGRVGVLMRYDHNHWVVIGVAHEKA